MAGRSDGRGTVSRLRGAADPPDLGATPRLLGGDREAGRWSWRRLSSRRDHSAPLRTPSGGSGTGTVPLRSPTTRPAAGPETKTKEGVARRRGETSGECVKTRRRRRWWWWSCLPCLVGARLERGPNPGAGGGDGRGPETEAAGRTRARDETLSSLVLRAYTSLRSAIMGSTRVALEAGSQAARAVTASSSSGIAAKVTGSAAVMP